MFKKLLLSLIAILSVSVFYAQECSDVTISIDMDNFPQEASWEITNENLTITDENFTMISGENVFTVCLEDGCYVLSMYDSFGDGWGFGQATGQVVVTTPSGTFEYVFDEGNSAILGFGVNTEGCEVTIEGCTDPEATNYNPIATQDDGSCEYPCGEGMVSATLYVCTFANGNEVAIDIVDEDGNIVYENSEFNNVEIMNTEICLDPEMCYTVNMYNTVNTGWYGGYYWVNANGVQVSTGFPADDENYATAEFSTNGPCGELILGCLDTTACNYDSNANWSDQSCTYPGCMDSTALNYNPEAGCEGECVYPEPCDQNEVIIFIDMDNFPQEASWEITNENLTITDENFTMISGENVFTVCLEDGCYVLSMFDSFGDGWGFGNATGQVVVTTPSGVFDYIFDSGDSAYLGFGVNTEGCEVTIEGCTDPEATNYNPIATQDDGSCEYPCEEGMESATLYVCTFANGNEVAIDIVDEEGNVVYENSDFNDLEIMNTEICLDPEMCYTVNMYNTVNTGWYGGYYWVNVNGVQVSTGFPADDENYATAEFSTNGPCGELILGCLDTTACNYDSNANWSDQSCTYPGCMDSTALNYNPEAGCEGEECVYPEPCDQNEVTIFINMDNFVGEASWVITDENSNVVDESSNYTMVPGENNFTLCLADGCYTLSMFDTFGDGWGFGDATGQVVVTTPSGTFEYDFDEGSTAYLEFGVNTDDCNNIVGGCTDEEACNYDSSASWDDNSCTYPGCMDSEAYNFDPFAGCDDDSCIYLDPVENDDCADAISLNCGETVTGTTIGAEVDNVVDQCGTSITAPGVWYSIEGIGSNINLSTCDQADYDTKISVFAGTCEALECVAGNDDGTGCSGFTSYLDFWGEQGVTYYILVHGFAGQTGVFELSAICSDVVPVYGCTDPLANNFDFEATVDDGSCIYGELDCVANFAIYDIDEENNLVVIVNMSAFEGLTYLWDFGDGTTSTEMLPVHFYDEDGTYTVCLTVTNEELACSDTFCLDVTYDGEGYIIDGQEVSFDAESGFSINIIDFATVSISENLVDENENTLVIYPNPASDQLTLQLNKLQNGNTNYQVLDLTGKVVLTNQVNQLNTTLDVSSLSNGIYLLKLSNKTSTQVQQFEISK